MESYTQSGYYAIIPAYVRYDRNLKSAEKLMYGEITALSNKEGYCFASNRYFSDLYGVSLSTISRWISHLEDLNYLKVELIRDEKKQIIERRLYIIDTPYMQNCVYPYTQKSQDPIRKKSKDNNININMIDRLFNYIINKEKEIPKEFKNTDKDKIINLLYKFDMLYTKEMIEIFSEESLNRLKHITYAIAMLVKDDLDHKTNSISRDNLIWIYNKCKEKELELKDSENEIGSFMNYYYKSIVNEIMKVNTPSFFVPKNDEPKENKDEELEI